jgi:hypothetical protein
MLDDSHVGEPAKLGKTITCLADFDKNVSVLDEGPGLYISMMQARISFDGFHMNS